MMHVVCLATLGRSREVTGRHQGQDNGAGGGRPRSPARTNATAGLLASPKPERGGYCVRFGEDALPVWCVFLGVVLKRSSLPTRRRYRSM